MAETPHVLILGGTADAVSLAGAAVADYRVTYSLAGRTAAPRLPENVEVRTGGFGGADALAGWIGDNHVAAVVDATHAYADAIAANAAAACTDAQVPRLKLLRAAWEAMPGDDWRPAADAANAAAQLPGLGRAAFLAIGRQDLPAFAGIDGMTFLVRTVDGLDPPPLANAAYVTGRGPFQTDREEALLRAHGIDVVVSKNAGGASTYGKISAARRLGLPVVMIARPAPPPGDKAADIGRALAWLGKATGGDGNG
jgi:precorrin-6A/cobalt-precorrin-6A reductase